MTPLPQNFPSISVVVPARNEEQVIAGCVESLVQQEEIAEIVVVNDQSTDRTAEIVRGLVAKHSRVKMIEVAELPAGWVGKNYAVWLGAREAKGEWLLFTDADAVHEIHAAARAVEIAREREAALVSFSPEQIMERWYEKALIPYVYCRLAKRFSYEQVNDPAKTAAAANGQFLLIRRGRVRDGWRTRRHRWGSAGGCGAGEKSEGRRLLDLVREREGNRARADVPVVSSDVGRLEKESVPVDGRKQ